MIEELVKEKREMVDREEENKIFNAIHKQAYWKKMDEENKRMLKNIEEQDKAYKLEQKKAQKKEFKARLIEDTLNFALFVMIAIPMTLLLVVLCY